jgi:hypothetical protein
VAGNKQGLPGIRCPVCGLRFTAVVDDHGATIKYAMDEWHQRCPSAALDSPSLCPNLERRFEPVLPILGLPSTVH